MYEGCIIEWVREPRAKPHPLAETHPRDPTAVPVGGIRQRNRKVPALAERLIVRGAREHNLKGVDIDLPRDRMVVFTGLSGSGKSSLAFDTIFAEGQRRYVESLSSYARMFLGQMEKPEVEF